MVVAVVNGVLAYFGLPLVHGVLPHSPLHVRAMADVEDRVSQGHVYLKSVTFLRENAGIIIKNKRLARACLHYLARQR